MKTSDQNISWVLIHYQSKKVEDNPLSFPQPCGRHWVVLVRGPDERECNAASDGHQNRSNEIFMVPCHAGYYQKFVLTVTAVIISYTRKQHIMHAQERYMQQMTKREGCTACMNGKSTAISLNPKF
jgi:hypothetical protein